MGDAEARSVALGLKCRARDPEPAKANITTELASAAEIAAF